MSRARSKDLQFKPAAVEWRGKYPVSANNLDRILDVLRHHYRGDSDGYINRTSRIEYRFGRSSDDKRIKQVTLLGSQSHIKVRFQFFRPRKNYPFRTKTLQDRNGNPTTHVVDFDLRPEDSLDGLCRLMLATETFSNVRVGVSSKDNKAVAAFQRLKKGVSFVNETAYDPRSHKEGKEMTLRAATLRLGQPKFRKKLLEYYQEKCLISDCEVVSVLEAAHITPYNGRDTNKIGNGLLLRADIHTLWDRSLIAINPTTFKISLAKKIRSGAYISLHGKKVDGSRLKLAASALAAHWADFLRNQ